MSNGGSFSAAISYAYNFVSGISYCASSVQLVFNYRNNPFAFRMAKFDDNEEVGPQGNYEAWQNDSTLNVRGICHDYDINDKQPIYPQRFARIPSVTLVNSQAIFNNLKNNGQLDSNNFALHSDSIKNHILANPMLYPSLISLSTPILQEILSQIGASNAEHKFYSDLNQESISFLNNACLTSSINSTKIEPIKVYPNPCNNFINLDLPEGIFNIYIYNSLGQKVIENKNLVNTLNIDVKDLESGLYIIKITNDKIVNSARFLKD